MKMRSGPAAPVARKPSRVVQARRDARARVGGMTLGWECSIGMHFSNSKLPLEGDRGVPVLRARGGDRFLVDLVEANEVEMVGEGCRAAEVWRVSEPVGGWMEQGLGRQWSLVVHCRGW